MFTKKSLALPLALVLLTACESTPKISAGAQEFSVYQKLASSQKHIEAISYLQLAVKKSPENAQYAAMLQQARQKAAMQLTASINELLGSGKLDKATLDKASSQFSQAKNILAKHDTYPGISALLEQKQTELETKIKSLYDSVKTNIASNEWIKAKFISKKLAALYPNYEDSAFLGQKVQLEGSRFYLNQANAAYKNNNFSKTLEYARKSLTINKLNKKATALIASTNRKNNKEYFLSLAQVAERAQDWSTVYKTCKSALSYDANNAYCHETLAKVKSQWTQDLLSQARQFLTQGYFSKSINAYKEANTINDGEKNDALAAIKQSLSDKIVITADELLASGHFGSSWYLLRLVADFNPVYPELFKKTKHAEDSINQRIKKSIAVFDFKSPSYNPDAGVLVANNLISNLFNSASKDINILERENLKSIIEEMKLGQIGVVSESSAQEMGRIYGIDIAIMGSVLLYKVDSTESTSSETVRYKVGEEISDNIDYLNWKAVNPNAKRDELRSAPKAKILIDKFEEKEYEVKHKKKVGFIQLSFRIVDVATGANTRVETIERKKIDEDRSNEGIKDAGITFDPMDIPTDTELLQQMATEVVAELSRDVLQPLRNLEKKYFEDGEDLFLRRKENLNAVEKFVDAIFDERLKSVVGSPITTQSNKYLNSIVLNHRFE